MDKTYQYKVYRDEEYLGRLPAVNSEFNISEEINTAGSSISITLASTFEPTDITLAADLLVTNTGDFIATPDNDIIELSSEYVFSRLPIALGNRLQVYMFSPLHTQGKKVFDGLISSWRLRPNQIVVNALSWGVKLNQHLIKTPADTIIEGMEKGSDPYIIEATYKDPVGRKTAVAQTFRVSIESVTSAVAFNIFNEANYPQTITVNLEGGTPMSSSGLLGSASATLAAKATGWVTFNFATPVTLAASTDYTLSVTLNTYAATSAAGALVYGNAAGGYASGSLYTRTDFNPYVLQTGDLAFRVYSASGTGFVGRQFLSADPSNIMRSLLDSFASSGGLITYDDTTLENTNSLVSYTFKHDTFLDGIKKTQELAPADWYYYVDMETNKLHFHPKKTSIDHKFVIGYHINDYDLGYSLENMKNVVSFSGGEVNGVNITTTKTSSDSINKYGEWLAKEQDGRVKLLDTAEILATGILNQHSAPEFETTLTISADRYDIESIKPGDVVGFSGGNSLIDNLALHIVSLSRSPDAVTLQIGSKPPSVTQRIQDLKRNLDKLETEKNPDL